MLFVHEVTVCNHVPLFCGRSGLLRAATDQPVGASYHYFWDNDKRNHCGMI